MSARLHEIASLAEVSEATVSRVLNGRPGVAERTRVRVLEAARTLGRRPDPEERAPVVGIVTPEIDNPVFAHLASALEQRLAARSILPVVGTATTDSVEEGAYVEHLLAIGAAGVIVVMGRYADTWADQSIYDSLERSGTPTVLVNGIAVGPTRFPAVSVDERAAAEMGVRHLRSLGHRRVGCLPGFMRYRSSQLKAEGWSRALADGGACVEAETPFTVEGGRSGGGALIDDGVTAVLCANDLMALGVVRAARDRGLSVPGDLSVVGYDGTPLTEFTDPALTTVRQPFEQMASAAVDLLSVAGTGPPRVQLHDAALLVRASTGPAPAPIRR